MTVADTRAEQPLVAGRSRTGRGTRLSAVRHILRRNPTILLGGGVLLILVLASVFAPVLAPSDPIKTGFATRVRPPSMTRVIASLAELGFVARTAHPADGRQVLVSVSDAGVHLIEAERRASQEWLRHRLGKLEPDQRATLSKAADLMSAIVDEGA